MACLPLETDRLKRSGHVSRGRAVSRLFCCFRDRYNIHVETAARLARELNLAFGKRKQGVVAANADALAWVFLRTALAHDDIARNDVLAAKFLDAKIFRV